MVPRTFIPIDQSMTVDELWKKTTRSEWNDNCHANMKIADANKEASMFLLPVVGRNKTGNDKMFSSFNVSEVVELYGRYF